MKCKFSVKVTNWDEARQNVGKVGGNTWIMPTRCGSYVVRYRLTDVVIYHKDGTFTLDHGGWETMNTARHMDHFTPGDVHVRYRFNLEGERRYRINERIEVTRNGETTVL